MSCHLLAQPLIRLKPSSEGQPISLQLAKRGIAALEDTEYNPDFGAEYLNRMMTEIPEASALVLLYVAEAHRSYVNECYLASAVMLGVASEAAFLEMAESFAETLAQMGRDKLAKTLADQRKSFNQKFSDVRAHLGLYGNQLNAAQPGLGEELDLRLNVIVDLLRSSRNEAGHPTGRTFKRNDIFLRLQMFVFALRTMYDVKNAFDAGKIEISTW